MSNPRPLTPRLAAQRAGVINSKRSRALPKPIETIPELVKEPKTPEEQIKAFREATTKQKAEFARIQRGARIIKRTKATAFTPRKIRLVKKEQAQQLEKERIAFEKQAKEQEAKIKTFEEAKRKQAEYDAAYKSVMRAREKGQLWAVAGFGEPLQKKIAKDIIKQEKLIKKSPGYKAAQEQRRELLTQLELPPETTQVELRKSLIRVQDIQKQNIQDWQKANPTERLVFDPTGNVKGVESGKLGKSISIREYVKAIPGAGKTLKTDFITKVDDRKSTVSDLLVGPTPSRDDRAITTFGVGGIPTIPSDKVDLSKIKEAYQKGKIGISKFYELLGEKTPKLYFDPSALKPNILTPGYKPKLTIIPSETTVTIKEIKELAKTKEGKLLSSQVEKSIEDINKRAEELSNIKNSLDKYPILAGNFYGTEKEYKNYLKDFSKYENKFEQYDKSFKNYEDKTNKLSGLTGINVFKEGVKGLAIKGIQYLPETIGQAAAIGVASYGGVRLAAPILSGIQKTLPGRLALTGSGIYFTAEGVKGAIDPTLTPEQRTLAGLSAGLGIGSGALSIGARARQFAKLRKLEQLRKTTPEISLGFARKGDKATELLVGARRRATDIESQIITRFDILPTGRKAFQIEKGKGAVRILEKKIVKEPRSFLPKGKRTYVRRSQMDFIMPESSRKFTFFGEGEQVAAKIITPTRAGEVIKKVPKRITPSVARIKMLSEENKLTNLMTGGFAKTEKGVTGVVSGRLRKGFVRDYALTPTIIDIPTKKVLLKEVTSGVKARFQPRDMGLIIDVRKVGGPSVGRKPTGRAVMRERTLSEGLVISAQLEKEALAQATREITKVKPRVTPPTFTGLITGTEARVELKAVVQKPVMSNLLVQQPTITDQRRRGAIGVKTAMSQKELRKIRQAQEKAKAQAQKQLQKQAQAQKQAQKQVQAQRQALKQEIIKPIPPVAKPPVVFDPFTSLTIPTRIPPKPRKKVAVRKPLRKKKKILRTLPTVFGVLMRGTASVKGRKVKERITGLEALRFT